MTSADNGAQTLDQAVHRPQGVHRPQVLPSPRFAPYPTAGSYGNVGPSSQIQSHQVHPPLPAGRSTQASALLRVGTLTNGLPQKNHPLKRVSWFPTPDTLAAARKGNLGHWTGKMEFAYLKRIDELSNRNTVPKKASDWASLNFGTKAKHLMRASNIAASAAIDKSLWSKS